MLDSRVRSFLAVCKYLSYTRAAQELNLTQPAITQHIQYLQDYYQVKFFVRKSNQLSLTPEGEYFRKTILTMTRDEKKLRKDLLSIQAERFIIQFGVTQALEDGEMAGRLTRYLEQFPDREIYMVHQDLSTLLQGLDDGTLHFAISDGFFPIHEYDSLPWCTQECVCVCGKGHPLAQETDIEFKDLLEHNMLISPQGSGMYAIVQRTLEDRNMHISDFARVLQIQDRELLKQLVEQGLGVGFVYRSNVAQQLEQGTLQVLPMKDWKFTHEFHFLWRKGSVYASLFRIMYDALYPTS